MDGYMDSDGMETWVVCGWMDEQWVDEWMGEWDRGKDV